MTLKKKKNDSKIKQTTSYLVSMNCSECFPYLAVFCCINFFKRVFALNTKRLHTSVSNKSKFLLFVII